MAEIPEHLLKRAEEAKARASDGEGNESGSDQSSEKKVPEELLDRTKAASDREAVLATQDSGAQVESPPPPIASGPAGHTQRLLAVVKSGSIQDVKLKPVDKVHVWPHLLVVEFVAALAVTAFSVVFSIFVNAPLLELANFNQTPNPSKAPWYFLGLQELLTMFHPMVAGVTIPGLALFL
ncbi:MAG: menaquinol-cytochrome c reductase cytochrome b subunit, partial [Actinomycetota bacterium]